jgi:hypothetical protein
LVGACSGDGGEAGEPEDDGGEAVDPYGGYVSDVYGDTGAWLCHPGLVDDACAGFAATEVGADRSQRVSSVTPAEDPGVDCFYVYPTVSKDPGPNSDRVVAVGDGEQVAVTSEAAPFTTECRVFAPIYRAVIDTAIAGATDEMLDLAYADVLDAWKTYISQDNEGRGVVLIGHSQGSIHLLRLLQEEIDDEPALRDRLVSTLLSGWSVLAPEGEDVGGSLQQIPACREAAQVGCVVTYASHAVDGMAPAGPFGQKGDDGRALCTDPVALSSSEGNDGSANGGDNDDLANHSGDGLADAILPVEAPIMGVLELGVDTPFAVFPDVVKVGCTQAGDYDYLAVSPAAADDGRPVELLLTPQLLPFLGLHVQDGYLAMGNLLEIVDAQAAAFADS